MQADQAMQCYESIAELSAQMLDAARERQWDELVLMQQQCAQTVDRLRKSPEPQYDASQLRRKFDILRKVLAEDAEVRALTEPWLAELDNILRGLRARRNLGQAYR
jgi:flagellar protein FliT